MTPKVRGKRDFRRFLLGVEEAVRPLSRTLASCQAKKLPLYLVYHAFGEFLLAHGKVLMKEFKILSAQALGDSGLQSALGIEQCHCEFVGTDAGG